MPAWLTFEWSDLVYGLRSGVEIGLLWLVAYALLRALERISAGGKIRGITLIVASVVAAWMLARFLGLHAITFLLQASIGFAALVLVVVFQPELRRLFSRLGALVPHGERRSSGPAINELAEAVVFLSSRRIGAIVVVERTDRLDDLVNTGRFDCDLTAKALATIFWKDSPLHDGAVIVREGRIAAAGVILPLAAHTDAALPTGTRHRAAMGISEDTDALVLVASEETGAISIAERGELVRGLSRRELEDALHRALGSGASGRRPAVATTSGTTRRLARGDTVRLRWEDRPRTTQHLEASPVASGPAVPGPAVAPDPGPEAPPSSATPGTSPLAKSP